MANRVLFLFFVLSTQIGLAQQGPELTASVPINGTLEGTAPLNIASNTLFFRDTTGNDLPFAAIRGQLFRPFAQKPPEHLKPSPVSTINTWLLFRVQNTHPTQTVNALLHVGRQGRIRLYDPQGHQLQQTGVYQYPFNVTDWQSIRLQVLPGQTRTFYVQVTNLVRAVDPMVVILHTPGSLAGWFAQHSHLTRWLFLGLVSIIAGLLIMSLFAFSQFVFNRDRVFLYYAIFCFIAAFYVLWNTNFRLGLGLPLQMHSTSRNFTFLIAFFYTLFLASFIQLPTHFPRVWTVLKVLLIVCLIQEAVVTYEHVNGLLFRPNWPYIRQDITFLVMGLILFLTLLRSQSPVRKYLLVGIGCLWTIAYFSMFLDLRFEGMSASQAVFINYIPFFFGLGMLCENFCFLLALAYRNRLVEEEKNQIQSQYTDQLEAELHHRTIQLEEQNRVLEAQRMEQLQAEFDQRLAETEMAALRSQMNPHFIFNCLNSVKLYTLQNDTDRAADYLTKFARLIRLVLENSRADRVTLANELEALQLYMELEAMRFKQKVQFSISVSPDIDTQFMTIPPLLIQPYVENAIWHGLMHKPEGGTLRISVQHPTDELLQITITDDGVGRARAAELKSKSANQSKSFGMKMTSERLSLINRHFDTHTRVNIRDLIGPNGQPAGTEVVLDIPV